MQLFLAFVVSLSATAALIPLLSQWAPRLGLTDPPGPRKVHVVPVPRVGGLAMAVGLLVPALVIVPLTPPVCGLLAGIVVLLAFGLWDDCVDLDYRVKFGGQAVAVALCMAIGDLRIGVVSADGSPLLPPGVAASVTFVFLIGVTNAVNLADGLDGLAGGLVLLCLCAVALFAFSAGQGAVVVLCLLEAGAILGFLRFNTHPARIFMGDSGSQLLGFSVGVLALLATQAADPGAGSGLSAALPLLLLGLPILDTLMVMVTRIRAGRSPFSADRNHLHHRLLAVGFSHRESVTIIYVLQVGLVLLAYFMRYASDLDVVLAFAAFGCGVSGLLALAARTGWHLQPAAPADEGTEAGPAGGTGGQPIGTHHSSPPPMLARIPAIALGVMVACLGAYAATVLIESRHVDNDLGLLSAGMLAALVLPRLWRNLAPAMFERTVAYMSVVLLVYLDQTAPHKPLLLATASWLLIGITGVAALLRFFVSPTRRFEVTTLDLIVIFIALVLPNLPGSVTLPEDLPQGIAKAVILLYVVEMLLNVEFKRLMPRVFLGATLAVIAGRALFGAGV